MAALSSTASLFLKSPGSRYHQQRPCLSSFPFFSFPRTSSRLPLLRLVSALDGGETPAVGPLSGGAAGRPKGSSESAGRTADEWGEKAELGEDAAESVRVPGADPPVNDDEWGGGDGAGDYVSANGSISANNAIGELKQSLVDTVEGTDFGLRASVEVRAEVVELVSQLEALNPTPAPVEAPEFNGNWVLVYTSFSELLPLIAVGSTPLLKLKRISQAIDTSILNILNTAVFSSPFATLSFSASASFEVRSPSRVQVKFEEGIFQPPELSTTLDLPPNFDAFGQTVDLSPLQQSLTPVQEVVTNISRAISGQAPLKVPIPGERSQSWLVTTYLDNDLRISRGDGGLFVLVKEGSPLLKQQ
ncbi:plastoglobulin-1, chloroplastic-like [Nymphaea colorata]|nr:plastoglobulin-1, chloroplastic-like [Nymphaea colorata]